MGRAFLTVPDELLEHADCAADALELLGFKVEVEKRDLGQPYTAALTVRRGRTRMVVEVMTAVTIDRIEDWVAFARSTGRDFRVVVVVPAATGVDGAMISRLKDLGVGLSRSHVAKLAEELPAKDLGLNVTLPDLARIPAKVRPLMGPIYEQFDRSNWREGFGDACTALEQEARRYLREGMASGRIEFVDSKGKLKKLTAARIDKLPMGPLGDTFVMIKSPNKVDSAVGEILARLNRDRVGEAHHKAKQITENRLRKNVGSHMHVILEGLRLLRE